MKGKADREIVKKLVSEILSQISDDSLSLKKEQILLNISNEDVDYVEIICKNWPQIHVMDYSTILEEEKGLDFANIDLDEDHHKINFFWYILIESAELFYGKYSRYPGASQDSSFENDVLKVRECMFEYLGKNNKIEKLQFDIKELTDDYIYEICRMSNSKVAPAVSVVASIASQEIIKLITYQFKSVNNTIIYDGVNNTLSTFRF